MSRLDELLKEYRAALDGAHRRAAQEVDPVNDPATLGLVERMIVDSVKALLEDFGERLDSTETSETLITRASAAVQKHEERFVEGAPLEFLAEEIGSFNQAIRDINYLREGFGRGVGRSKPKPADMKWSHGRAIESYVRDTVRRVAGELKSDGAEVHRLSPEVDLDLPTAYRGIVALLEQDLGAREFMDAVIELGKRQTQLAGWDVFRDLPYEDELEKRSSFFVEVVQWEPPAIPLTGFGVQIAYPSRDGETTADLWLMGGSGYQPNDETWLDVQEYLPREHSAHSEVLAAIYHLAYVPGGLGNAADYTLCLAWCAYLSRACAHYYLREEQLERIGLRVGFGGGDWIDFGWISAP